MVIQLDDGQTITIYEQGNLLKQIEPYIDKEIYDLLYDKFGFIQNTYKDFNLVKYGYELVGQTIKHCEIGHGSVLENSIIATEEGNVMILNGDCDDDNYIDIKALTKEQLDRQIVKNSYFRNELLDNNIVDKNYIQKLLDIEKFKSKEDERKIKEKRYAEYLKMKKEFEGNE
jgi:hypothetical protein